MTTSYDADRVNLSCLRRLHPDWTQPQLAQASGEPLGQVVQGHWRARKHPPQATHPLAEERILAIGDRPPEGLRRTPGPQAIGYDLPRDPELQAAQMPLPRSSRTIYGILKKPGRILQRHPRRHEPQERNAPLVAKPRRFQGCEHGASRCGGQTAARGRNPQHPRQWHLGAPRCPGAH